MTTLSRVTVRARAVIPFDEGIVVVRESRRGRPCTTIPGGRVMGNESVAEAVVREVREETSLDIEVGPLRHVAEAQAPIGRQDVNLIFLATIADGSPSGDAEVIELRGAERALPPILHFLRCDRRGDGWRSGTAWLGNIWDRELER